MKWRVYEIEWDKNEPELADGKKPRYKYEELPKETVVQTGDFNGFYETDWERRQDMIDEISEELIEKFDWCPNVFGFKEIP